MKGVTLKRETGGPGVGEERDKGRTRETETRWIMSKNETGRRGENKWFYLNHELFFYFVVTDTLLSLPKTSLGLSFPKHPNPRSD